MIDTHREPLVNTAVIFAGGKSSRMGQDKALLPFGGEGSMAAYQYKKLHTVFKHVYLSTKAEKFDQRHFGATAAPLIQDRYPQSSPMVALASLFETLEAEAVFILSVDMPLLDIAIIKDLRHAYQASDPKPDAIIAKSPRGIEPLCGIYHRSTLPHIQALLREDTHKMRALFTRINMMTITYTQHDAFANINTPQEYQDAIHP